jgi:putative ABC transport system substrate-binding protein
MPAGLGESMRRREFIALLGSGAIAWPRAARSRPAGGVARVAILPAGYAQTDPEGEVRVTAFLKEFETLGWSNGRNVEIDIRWPARENERIRADVASLIGSAPDALVVSSNLACSILENLNKTIPTVFVQVSDPVGSGFVDSLAHPNRNITGFQNFEPAIAGKWAGLLKEAAPGLSRVAVLVYPDTAAHFQFLHAAEAVAPSLGIQVSQLDARDSGDIERAIVSFANRPNGGLIVLPHPDNISSRGIIIDVTARLHLPAIYPFQYFAASGGLMSYGFDQVVQWRGAAGYVSRILRGEKTADLPVQAPTRYELTLNLKTAKALDLTVSQTLQASADHVIE